MQIAYRDEEIHVWVTEVGHKRIVDGQKAWKQCREAFHRHFKEGEWTYDDNIKRWTFDDTKKNRAKLRAIQLTYFK